MILASSFLLRKRLFCFIKEVAVKLFINDLTVMDFSFLDAESGLIGDSLIVDIILEGDLNAESMVMDFSHAKKSIKHEIDKLADHVLIVPEQNSHIIVSHAGTT
ncbi:6-carboxytetrahydropterin synthase, partial [Klebsiella pneumoniae]|nr:6-carboxytetrahydropterin synthase [Klebsiella pneumoniae]MCQ8687518.1 6-carboxytetrahydropterin synthase [Klebsiella pneumoniae]MCQ8707918.1 6-carboxytetrahydropterin synthase [Klebsiella pneumoniae]